jgi:hypothetical protein
VRCQVMSGRAARGQDSWGRSGDAGLGGAGSGVAVSIRRREVRRVARGRSGELADARGGQLDYWVQVMDLCSITLSDE